MDSLEFARQFYENEANQAKEFDMDALQRAALRRSMGFDFKLTIKDNRMIVTDEEYGLKSTCFYHGKLEESDIKRLVKACMRLKKMHDNYVA